MAEVAGKGGLVKEGSNTVSQVRAWTLDFTCDPLETTDFGDSGHKTYIAGLDGWSGSLEAHHASGAAPLTLGTTYTLHLILDNANNKEYSGSAIVTGLHPNVSVDGVVTVSVDFQGSGTLTVPS